MHSLLLTLTVPNSKLCTSFKMRIATIIQCSGNQFTLFFIGLVISLHMSHKQTHTIPPLELKGRVFAWLLS